MDNPNLAVLQEMKMDLLRKLGAIDYAINEIKNKDKKQKDSFRTDPTLDEPVNPYMKNNRKGGIRL